jgi:MFS family permease
LGFWQQGWPSLLVDPRPARREWVGQRTHLPGGCAWTLRGRSATICELFSDPEPPEPGTTGTASDAEPNSVCGVGNARRARIGVSIVFAVCGAGFATWAARVPAAQEKLGLTAGELAIGLFGLAAGSVLALLVAGPLVTTIGSRIGSLAGALLLCAGLPAIAFASDLTLFVGALVLLGAGNSLLDVSMNAHAARVAADYGRPIFASFHAYWNVGGLAGSGLAAAMAAAGVSITVHFAAAATVLALVAASVILGAFLTGPDTGQGDGAFALPSRRLIPLGVIAFCGFLAEGTVNDWSAVLITTTTDAAQSIASLGYFAFSTSMILVRLLADRAANRTGPVLFTRVSAAVTMGGSYSRSRRATPLSPLSASQ